MKRLDKSRTTGYAMFPVLLGLYIAAAGFTPRVSRSMEMLLIGQARLPVSALTGDQCALTNIRLRQIKQRI